ncbi:hypothetical protein TCAL_11453 [Tigriopus californicus]|uniref:RNA helicase n=1 Tax=Tigriopus californicus TaxID=6832 RepID=A0A553P3V6_TIGCA|nr:probable ATP-dependent RNA helicase kurz [Tigriopus californicus]TRY72330.1 hypothetical protein TCAL_11453 [Tigriopus californicus]|eukprot:TCALIF_11453-PA protein Name:"Similar to kz Probable ATP-dependent RNA helicase kurz (Drosophila melanogaster)" AED:0.00 eAED:0.00 QI:116/1/0.5/1/1/1/2/0/1190
MGRSKKGFNWRARQPVAGHYTDEKQIQALEKSYVPPWDKGANEPDPGQVDLKRGHDEANAWILPAQKRCFKREKSLHLPSTKLLSKKRRKHLEKVVQQKHKKAQWAQLIQDLGQVQCDPQALDQMTSISMIQTKGLKRQFAEDQYREQHPELFPTQSESSSLARLTPNQPLKRAKLKKLWPKPPAPESRAPDVLGLEEPSSSEASSSEDDSEDEPPAVTPIESSPPAPPQEAADARPVVVPPPKSGKIPRTLPINRGVPNPSTFISVHRHPEVQTNREKLPILAEEQIIMEAIHDHPVVVLAGETGSGKTTQVPQFLYEAGYTKSGKLIGVTEPRRVAAMSMSQRVGFEMNLPDLVSYQIRFEGNTSEQTRIKFMTDGVLLREMAKDFRLRKYSVIIIDEAHERSVFTDILIGNLSRIVPLRAKDTENGPLKLIVMSATLRVEDFTENSKLFKTVPPVIKVESRQFETTCHFQRTTPDDYVSAALKKACKIHRELPEGGILIFVTGQQEVNQLVRKLRDLYPSKNLEKDQLDDFNGLDEEDETIEKTLRKATLKRKKGQQSKVPTRSGPMAKGVLPRVDLNQYRAIPLDDTEADAMRDDQPEEEDVLEADPESLGVTTGGQPLWCLPLYSLLNSDKQARIFEPVPEGHRLCVVSTNIAETSLTIPGIKYVVDCGKVKTKFYDKLTGVTTYQVTWGSKAAANQRAGRAGRVAPGHCYRLFSSEVFKNDFPLHAQPEILKRPVDDLVLQMKAMGIMNVINFPFPTPPEMSQLKVAERRLLSLGALRFDKASKIHQITPLGKSMSAFPVAPCFAKMLALSEQQNLMPYTISLVSALTVQEVLLETPVGNHEDSFNQDEVRKIRKIWAGKGNHLLLGDPMILLKAIHAAEYEAGSRGNMLDFCNRYALRHKAMIEIRKLRRQLTNEVNLVLPHINLALDPKMSLPDDNESNLLRQIVLAGMVNQVGRRLEVPPNITDPKERAKLENAYQCGNLADPVFMHGRSIFFLKKKTVKPPEWIVYQEVFETDRMHIRGMTAIEPEWLPVFAKTLCNFLPPCQEPEPWYDIESGRVMCKINGTFGPQAWPLPTLTLPYPDTPDGGAVKYFARFLLEGLVTDKLDSLKEALLVRPLTFTRSASYQGEHVKKFLQALADEKVACRASLAKVSKKNPEFLLNEFKAFVPKAKVKSLPSIWPLC